VSRLAAVCVNHPTQEIALGQFQPSDKADFISIAHKISNVGADAGGIGETQTTKRIAMTLSKRARLVRNLNFV
jgi:hypothetical protein